MFKILQERLRQGCQTMTWPDAGNPPLLPERFKGMPEIDPSRCRPGDAERCAELCPTGAISLPKGKPVIDLGRCIFCGDCEKQSAAIKFTGNHQLSARNRKDLEISGKVEKMAAALNEKMLGLFGRSLKLREVSAAGCNACEFDVNVLNTIGWDLSRFGIQIVASPRHADGLLITGPVSTNMRLALEKTYAAVASPKIVIAVGACAISGGPYIDHPEIVNGAQAVVPVDLYIPGCPPHPLTILDGLLRFLGKIEDVS